MAIACVHLAAAAVASQDWTADMDRFAAEDAAAPSPPGCVLFLGSSSIRMWSTLAADFPGVNAVNRGFGGSHIADSIVHFGRLVAPHDPRMIVFFAGTNDIASGKSPEEVASDFREFCAMVHSVRPNARVVFISIQFAPIRWGMRERMALANTYIARFCASDERLTYVESNAFTLSTDGRPRPELFLSDQLHMNSAGYAIWAKMLRSHVLPPEE